MLDKLPTELALRVLETAATELRFTHRQSVVNLALTSSPVYKIVAPILYHTIIVTAKTRTLIAAFTHDESTRAAAKRICSHARVLHDDAGSEKSINPKLLINVVNLSAIANFARDVAEAQCQIAAAATMGPPLREITNHSVEFEETIKWIPQRSRELITHATGYVPVLVSARLQGMFFSSLDMPGHGARWWTRSIIDALPALTHFALVLAAENRVRVAVDAFDLEALGKALATAVTFPRLKTIVLKVCGGYVERRREEIDAILDRILDSRLSVMWEQRPLISWEEYDEWSREDVVLGRNIWTEATPVHASFKLQASSGVPDQLNPFNLTCNLL